MVSDLRRAVRAGQDPVEAKREKRDTRLAQITFGKLATEYIAAKEAGWRSQSHRIKTRMLLLDHAKAIGRLGVASITPKDIEAAVRPLWNRAPAQAKRTLMAISQVFDYAIALEHRADNPADWKRRLKPLFPRLPDAKHYTAMNYASVPHFVRKLHVEQKLNTALSPYVIEFLLLTACRAGEATGMRWEEVDFDARVWTVPKTRTKTGREHRVPLCGRTMELLQQQRQCADGDCVWQITGPALYKYLTRDMGVPVTIHGFRSSFRDWAGNETHFDRVTCELCLGHKAGDATELAYRRGDALAKRRELMDAWANYCAGKPVAPSQEAPQRATGGHR
jgi:integrase